VRHASSSVPHEFKERGLVRCARVSCGTHTQHGHLDDQLFSHPVALYVPQSCTEYATRRLTCQGIVFLIHPVPLVGIAVNAALATIKILAGL
jgi:hypothetical protein